MFSNVLPKKVPQTLVYGVRQVLIQPQPEELLPVSKRGPLNIIQPSSLREFVDEISGDGQLATHLTSNTVLNVAQGIVQSIGIDKLKEIATNSLGEQGLLVDDDPPAHYGYLDPDEHFIEEDPVLSIISPYASPHMEQVKRVPTPLSLPSNTTAQKKQVKVKTSLLQQEQQQEHQPSKSTSSVKFEDITHKNEHLVKWREWMESWVNTHFRALVDLIHRMIWGANGNSITERTGLEREPEQKQIMQLTFFGVFFAASYATDMIIMERFKSPSLSHAFRRTLAKIVVEFRAL